MKLRILIVSSFFSLFTSAQQRNIDVLHYKYHIELNDKNDTIYGVAAIQFKLLDSIRRIQFNLVTRTETGKGMKIDKIDGPGIRGFMKTADSINIFLASASGPAMNDTVTYIITYHGIPEDGLIISRNKHNHRTFFADNWPDRAHYWIPCVDDPADKASVEFLVIAPDHYQVISNGILIKETNLEENRKLTHYKEDLPLPTKVMVIGVADFAVELAGNVDSIPVYSWLYPEEKKNGFHDYVIAKDILGYYINYIGPFPYKKLANVQSKTIFGGMENAGAIFYSENSVTGNRTAEYLLAHEIVHQWFGDMATEKSYPHLWLSEGFATYLTHVYAESKIGFEGFNERMRSDRYEVIEFVRSSPKPVVDTETAVKELLNPNSYQRGGWVLHMLRRQLGDSVFHRAVKSYYETYKGLNADTRDLQSIFEKESGKNLDTFFRQWLFTADIPKLDITWKYDPKAKQVSLTVKQLQQSGPFIFPLDIYIQDQGSLPSFTTISISKEAETFTFPIKNRMLKMLVDPFVSILYDGKVTETK